MRTARTLVSYKLPTSLHRELKRASHESHRDMTGVVEEAVREWLVTHRWLSRDLDAEAISSADRTARARTIARVASVASRYEERMPGRSHDNVLYGSRG